MVQATGSVLHNLQTIRQVAERNQESDIRITSSEGEAGPWTGIKAVNTDKRSGAFLGFFGVKISRKKDASGSSQQFISAFKDHYGSAAFGVLKDCGVKEGKALLGRDVARAMDQADALLKKNVP